MVDGARFCPRCGHAASIASLPTQVGEEAAWNAAGPTVVGDPLIGRTLEGKYRIDAVLGEGGMGTVYRATRLLIGDTVALKILHSDTMRDPSAIERFRREAQAAARLKHPNVVAIHDFGVGADDTVYLVMEFADGEDLRALIDRFGRLSPAVASELMDQLCSALDEAHQRNIVHRDLKPENILIRSSPGGYRIKILDFGIAKLRDLSTTSGGLTQAGTVVGTPFYMSPEQCRGREVDPRSDIYALGVILYEMLTGSVPFEAKHSAEVVAQHVSELPTPPTMRNPAIPPAVEAVVLRALQKRPEARQQSAGEFAKELSTAVRAAATPDQLTQAMPQHVAPVTVASMPASTGTIPPGSPTPPGHPPPQGLPPPEMLLRAQPPQAPFTRPTIQEAQSPYPMPPPGHVPTAQMYGGQPMPGAVPAAPVAPARRGLPLAAKLALGVFLLVIGIGLGIGAKFVIEKLAVAPASNTASNGNADGRNAAGTGNAGTTTGTGTTNQQANANANANANADNANRPPETNANGNTANTNTGPSGRTGRITTSKVTVRDAPSIRGAAIGLLDPGDRVEILEERENTSANEGMLSNDAPFSGESAAAPDHLPKGRGVIIIGEAGDGFYVETTDGGRTIRGYVRKSDVAFGSRRWLRVRSTSGKSGWVNAQFVAVE